MFKVNSLFVFLLLNNCSDEVLSEPIQNNPPDNSLHYSPTDDTNQVSPAECSKTEKIRVSELDGGSNLIVVIPLPCNPLWKWENPGYPIP